MARKSASKRSGKRGTAPGARKESDPIHFEDSEDNGESEQGSVSEEDEEEVMALDAAAAIADGESESDDNDDGDGDEQASGTRWGTRAGNFYNADDVDADEDAAAEEEEEAKRLERKQLGALSERDLGLLDESGEEDSDNEDGSGSEGGEGADGPAAVGSRVRAGVVKGAAGLGAGARTVAAAGSLLGELAGGFAGLQSGATAEASRQSLSGRTRAERLAIVQKDTPELLGMLAQFRRALRSLREEIQPAAERARRVGATEQGVSYLEVKFHAMLGYCTALAFYVLLKARGARVAGHPVVDQLVEHRVLLERLRPLDRKLDAQLSRLLREGAQDRPAAAAAGTGAAAAAAAGGDAALRFRPDVSAMDDTVSDSDGAAGGGRARERDAAAFRPSKLASVSFDDAEKGAVARERKARNLRARAQRNLMMQELRAEVGDAPEEVREGSAAARRYARDEEDKRAFEEANFMRFAETRKDKRARKAFEARHQRSDVLEGLAEFGALEKLVADGEALRGEAAAEAEAAGAARRRTLAQYLNQVEQKRGGAGGRGGPVVEGLPELDDEARAARRDEAEGRRAKRARGAARASEDALLVEASARAPADERATQLYDAMAAAQADRKAVRQAKFASKPLMAAPAATAVDGPRAATAKIVKNRGLMPSRGKLANNPRLKKRVRFEQMQKRRRGQVRDVRTGEGEAYAGEATGVKAHVTHSRKLGLSR